MKKIALTLTLALTLALSGCAGEESALSPSPSELPEPAEITEPAENPSERPPEPVGGDVAPTPPDEPNRNIAGEIIERWNEKETERAPLSPVGALELDGGLLLVVDEEGAEYLLSAAPDGYEILAYTDENGEFRSGERGAGADIDTAEALIEELFGHAELLPISGEQFVGEPTVLCAVSGGRGGFADGARAPRGETDGERAEPTPAQSAGDQPEPTPEPSATGSTPSGKPNEGNTASGRPNEGNTSAGKPGEGIGEPISEPSLPDDAWIIFAESASPDAPDYDEPTRLVFRASMSEGGAGLFAYELLAYDEGYGWSRLEG